MADKVHADTTAIIKYAGNIGGMTAKDGGPMAASLNATMPLNQMGEVMMMSFTPPPTGGDTDGQFPEALELCGYNADNMAAFKQFIPAASTGITACAQQAQGVGLILSYTDGDSAGNFNAVDVANALAYSSGDPGAKRPAGVPKDVVQQKTMFDMRMEAQSGPQQAEAITDPNSQFAKEDPHEPGSYDTITRYPDGSYRVISSYPTTINGVPSVHTETKFYGSDNKEIANSGQAEDNSYGKGYTTTVRHEGGTTVTTTTHDDNSVDIKTTTKDAHGKDVTTTSHTDAPKDDGSNDNGPVQNWEAQAHTDGRKMGFEGY